MALEMTRPTVTRVVRAAALAVLVVAPAADAAAPAASPARSEIVHPATGHDAHRSAPALAIDREGPLVAWTAPDGHGNAVYVARPVAGPAGGGHSGGSPTGGSHAGGSATRVSPAGSSADSLHQAPGLAVGPQHEIYVTWSARGPKPVGGLFSAELQLSRSLDGGRTFEAPLPIRPETAAGGRPSQSFEDLAVLADGTVVVAWIETPSGDRPHTYLARVVERGRRVEGIVQLDTDETCVCCRVALATAGADSVSIFWRKVFPESVRDMVMSRSRDGGRTVGAAARVHADQWKISGCPHRGGRLAVDGRGRLHAAWYTEGTRNEPNVLYAVSDDGRRFNAPRRVHVSTTSIPDQPRLAVEPGGRGLVVWEGATAVRRQVMMRETDVRGGLGPVRVLSTAIKAYAPDVTIGPDGEALIAWHEEQFPLTKTVVVRLKLAGRPR